jgi:hypothetical protein
MRACVEQPGTVPVGWRRVRYGTFDGAWSSRLACERCLERMGFKP